MKLLVATSNPGKFHEIAALFAGSPFELVFLGDLDIPKDLEENGNHYSDNALLKAKHFHALTKIPTLGEDSGIEIEALGDELGVKTRRWGAGEGASDEAWLAHFMERMKDETNRKARFIAHIAYYDGKTEKIFDATTEGIITETIEAPVKRGIPLSSVFRADGYGTVYAAMTEEEKGRMSHRGKAVKKMREWLESDMKTESHCVLFTGGGTLGHVSKNIAVIEALHEACPNLQIDYIGSGKSLETEVLKRLPLTYHRIATGKFRRYMSFQNVLDLFAVPAGIIQSTRILRKIRPKIIFSSGGYVALPVCVAAWMLRIPIVTHESDSVPGLANRIIGKVAQKVCVGFESAKKYFSSSKTVYTGNPVRKEILMGSKKGGLELTGFSGERKVLLIMGGSQGAKKINDLASEILPELVKQWHIIHITGEGKSLHFEHPQYRQFPILDSEKLADIYAITDVIISRAGAGAIAEIQSLRKPCILIPLSSAASNHQAINAREAATHLPSKVLDEKQLTPQELLNTIENFRSVIPAKSIAVKLHFSPAAEAATIILQNYHSG